VAPNRWTISSNPGTSTFRSHVGRHASHISLGSGHRGRRRSLSIAGGDRAVVSNQNACLSSNSSPSCAVRQYSSNASTFAPVSRKPGRINEPAAAGPARQSPALHPAPADGAGGVGQLGAACTVATLL
jgi:hypothetical protein